MTFRKKIVVCGLILSMTVALWGCGRKGQDVTVSSEAVQGVTITAEQSSEETSLPETTLEETRPVEETAVAETTQEETTLEETSIEETTVEETTAPVSTEKETTQAISSDLEVKEISLDMDWKYAEYSAIHDGTATFYPATGSNAKNITVCVNAGHGTRGGSGQSTYSHPDKTGKCTGGTNANGAVKSIAIAEGTDMDDGTPESAVTLKLALIVKEDLLEAGYNVLMIRETEDVQLDNIARTVIANNNADCHIALHYDGTSKDKGAFFCSVPDVDSYKSMEPVASMWKSHNRLGWSLIEGLKENGVKIWSSGEMEIDLTQTSYSTIPSVDLEVGDQASDYSKAALSVISKGIVDGVNEYFE